MLFAQALAVAATLVSFTPHGNRIELKLDKGAAEIQWVTPSTFRFRRTPDAPLPQAPPPVDAKAVDLRMEDTPAALVFHTRFMDVSIQKRGLLVTVRRDGEVLMTDISEPRAVDGGFAWERSAHPDTRFYGLGMRASPGYDLRGTVVAADVPFLVSTDGYGEYHPAPGTYKFDLTGKDRYRVQAPAVDYYFYCGPKPKEIFDEHLAAWPDTDPHQASAPGAPTWSSLRDSILRMTQASMSAIRMPSFDSSAYARAPEELTRRARQLGSVAPAVIAGSAGQAEFRKQLATFLRVYDYEMHERGFPIWHPLPFQFPDDAEAARHADEFMLGDEMLVAPIYEPGGKRSVYLPRGVWTNLETNEEMPGRRTVTVSTEGLPVFARNGTIVPFDTASGGMILHYFPKLGAEFFLLETDPPAWSQAHAAPAADIMRLEIEAKKARVYDWVVHHVDRPAAVGFEDRKYPAVVAPGELTGNTWFYDAAARNLYVRVKVTAGEDSIVNLNFE